MYCSRKNVICRAPFRSNLKMTEISNFRKLFFFVFFCRLCVLCKCKHCWTLCLLIVWNDVLRCQSDFGYLTCNSTSGCYDFAIEFYTKHICNAWDLLTVSYFMLCFPWNDDSQRFTWRFIDFWSFAKSLFLTSMVIWTIKSAFTIKIDLKCNWIQVL